MDGLKHIQRDTAIYRTTTYIEGAAVDSQKALCPTKREKERERGDDDSFGESAAALTI